MEYSLSCCKLPTAQKVINSSSSSRTFWNHQPRSSSSSSRTFWNNQLSAKGRRRRRRRIVVEASGCSLNAPLEARGVLGKYLRGVLLNQRELFDDAIADELKRLARDRHRHHAAFRIINNTLHSNPNQHTLHRRIAELKEQEWRMSVEDIMYVMIISKFSDIKVPLVPRLSRCIYNNRLEILPSKDWELESIHGFESLEMIKEHISAAVGLRANSSINEHWAITKVQLEHLAQVYAASILFGYFLKSASLRLHLEWSLASANHRSSLHFPEPLPHGLGNFLSDRFSNVRSTSFSQGPIVEQTRRDRLRCYVMGFDPETMQRCAKLKSKESVNLVENHTCALFGDERTGLLENNKEILTSYSSLKRLVLEAVAFGIFLWDTEEYVDTVYELVDNK